MAVEFGPMSRCLFNDGGKHYANESIFLIGCYGLCPLPESKVFRERGSPVLKPVDPINHEFFFSAFIKQIDQDGRGRIPVNLCQNTFRHSCEAYRIKCKL